MADKFKVRVFGKPGCAKCKILNQRLDDLLSKPEWTDFEKDYCDVDTEEGLVQFCMAESLNPQRIPAFVVARVNPQTGNAAYVPNPRPDEADPVCKGARLYPFLGLQTDYSSEGKGVISSEMIAKILGEARTKGG